MYIKDKIDNELIQIQMSSDLKKRIVNGRTERKLYKNISGIAAAIAIFILGSSVVWAGCNKWLLRRLYF